MSRFIILWACFLAPMAQAQQVPNRIAAVTVEDAQGVANLCFKPETRTVAPYYTKKGEAAEEDPLLAGLSDQEKVQVRQFREAVAKMSIDEANAILQKLAIQKKEAPPERKGFVEALYKLLQMKIQNGVK